MKTTRAYVFMLMMLFVQIIHAQHSIQMKLIDANDSIPIAFAKIEDLKTGKIYRSDIKGEFELVYKKKPSEIKIHIRAVAYSSKISFQSEGISEKQLFLEKQILALQEAQIKGLSAVDILQKMIAAIPQNYEDSSFLMLGNYRQYHRINGKYKNLIEAQMGIASHISKQGNQLKAKESFAIIQLRRGFFNYPIEGFLSDDISDLMYENPIYHLMRNSLNPGIFSQYELHFDTSSFTSRKEYIIYFKNKGLPAERHSIESYENGFFSGEAFEEGYVVIDKESFALIEMERTSTRNPAYHYPLNNNYVLPARKYTLEFGSAHFKIKFEKKANKWFMKEIYHQFSHDFFDAFMGNKKYEIAEFFEWNTLLNTKVLPAEIANDFYETTALSVSEFVYQPEAWLLGNMESYYLPLPKLYEELGKVIPLEIQFKQ